MVIDVHMVIMMIMIPVTEKDELILEVVIINVIIDLEVVHVMGIATVIHADIVQKIDYHIETITVIILIHVIASPTIYAIVKDLDMNLEDMIVDPPVKHTDDIVPVGRYPTTKMHLKKPIVTYLIMKRVSYFLRMPLQTPMVIKKKLIVIQRVRSLIIKHLRIMMTVKKVTLVLVVMKKLIHACIMTRVSRQALTNFPKHTVIVPKGKTLHLFNMFYEIL